MRTPLAFATLTIVAALAPALAAEAPPGAPTARAIDTAPAATAKPAKPDRPPISPVGQPAKPPPPTAKKPERKATGQPQKKAEYKGPSESDIRTAYAMRVDRINAGSDKYLSKEAAERLRIRLIKVDFIECDPVDARTELYVCNVLVESALGAGEADFKRIELVMAKENRVWTVR